MQSLTQHMHHCELVSTVLLEDVASHRLWELQHGNDGYKVFFCLIQSTLYYFLYLIFFSLKVDLQYVLKEFY